MLRTTGRALTLLLIICILPPAALASTMSIQKPEGYVYNERGMGLFAEGKFDQAIAELTKAIAANPRYAYVYNNRGLVYYAMKKFDLAIANGYELIEVYRARAIAYSALKQ